MNAPGFCKGLRTLLTKAERRSRADLFGDELDGGAPLPLVLAQARDSVDGRLTDEFSSLFAFVPRDALDTAHT